METAQIDQDEYRKKWAASLPLETDRIRWEVANSGRPYSNFGRATREDVFDCIRECFALGETLTVSQLREEFIGYSGTEVTKGAIANHLYAARDCGLLKLVQRGSGVRRLEAVWRRAK